jgi:molybdopterin-binding protein
VCAAWGACAGLSAQSAAAVPLAERARGAERVLVGQVVSVAPSWQVNAFGDRLIVSTLRVDVDEILKGAASAVVDVEVEGGTIDGLTLHVSDQLPLAPGERAVFFVRRTPRGTFAPHLRGQSLLKLDAADRVQGTTLTLNDIRREVAAANVR